MTGICVTITIIYAQVKDMVEDSSSSSGDESPRPEINGYEAEPSLKKQFNSSGQCYPRQMERDTQEDFKTASRSNRTGLLPVISGECEGGR